MSTLDTAIPDSPRPPAHILLAFGLMLMAAALAVVMRPHIYLAQIKPPLKLEKQIPLQFGDWKIDKTQDIVLPNPELQARLDKLYTQTLSRTYVNSKGQQVMLSVAYGSDQSNEATAAHRPEFCYQGAGYHVTTVGTQNVQLSDHKLMVMRLVADRGDYMEPITYWVTLDEHASLPGLHRKLEQFRYGLRGLIPDGMLMRLSSAGNKPEQEYALHDKFITDLEQVMSTTYRPRYFGS